MHGNPAVERFTKWLAMACLMLAAIASISFAQTTTGSIRGQVSAEGAGPLGDATITARDTATGFERSTVSRENGFYNLASLNPGRYTVTVRRLGYGQVVRRVTVGIGQSITLDLPLSTVSTELTAVTVVATPVVETRTSEVATNVTPEQIENLPSADRNFMDLAALAPGVTLQGTGRNDTRRTFSAGAQSAENINVFIDGATYKNDILKGGIAGQDASRGNPFSRNAIQEFRVITQNYKAEYQKASSAIITAVTKSGTNVWAGNAFYAYQNKSLVALDAFQRIDDLKNKNYQKPDYSRNLMGLSVGGPIVKDRLHFFGSYEGNYQTRTNRVNIVPPTTGGPNAGRYPALDSIDFASRNGEFDSPFKSTLLFGKLTFQQSQRSQLEVSANTRSENDVRDFGTLTSFDAATRLKNSVNTGIVKHRFDMGSMLNEAMLSYQNYHYNPEPENPAVANRFFGFGCCAEIGGNRSSQDFTQKRLALRNDLTWSGFQAGGQHIVKGGVNVDFLTYDIIKRNSETPRFTYEPWFNAFAIPEKVEFQSGDPNFSTKNRQTGLYIQDDWTPMPKLTVNLGVRWDHESGMLNYDHVTPRNIVDSLTKYANLLNGYPLDPKRYFTDGDDREPWKGAIQPRLGFSYSIDKEARTTVFGGWGIFVDRTVFDQAIEEKFSLQHPSYTIRFRPVGDTDPNRVDWNPIYLTQGKPALDALIATRAANTAEVKLLPNDLRPPMSQQSSVGVRQLLGNWAIDATWTNVRSKNVMTFYWANENFTCTPRSFACFQHNTIPGFGNILLADNKGKTWYNALQLKLDRQFRRTDADFDWGVGAAYTYARRETEGFNDDFSFPTPGDYPRQFRNDERGRFVGNWIMESERAWNIQFSGVATIGSGARLDVGDRFGGAGNPLIPGGFATPTFTNVDLRFRKDFAVAAQRLGITVDLFNALNAQNYGGFNTFNPNDSNFGRPSTVIGDPQRIQIGMEVSF